VGASLEQKDARVKPGFLRDANKPLSVPPVQPQQASRMSAMITNLSDQIPLVFHAARELACFGQRQRIGVELLEFQPNLLMDGSESEDHIRLCAPREQSDPCTQSRPRIFLHGSTVTAEGRGSRRNAPRHLGWRPQAV
jgi:hypothetical protein